MSDTETALTLDEVKAILAEKGIDAEVIEEEGWGPLDELDETDLVDVAAWLEEQRGSRKKAPRSDVQEQMVNEARQAGVRASQAQADPVKVKGKVFEKKVGRYLIDVVEADTKKPGMRMIVVSAWVGDAVMMRERHLVPESNVEGKAKQHALKMIEAVR